MVEIVVRSKRFEKPNNLYQLGAMRWANVKQNTNKKLSGVIDMEKGFNFRPYTYTPGDISKLQFHDDDGTNMSLMLSADIH